MRNIVRPGLPARTAATVAVALTLAATMMVSGLPGPLAPVASAAAEEPYVLGGRLEKSRQPAASNESKAANTSYREFEWDSLVPEDWDPMKSLGALDFSQMSDNDPRAVEALKQLQDAWKNAPVNANVDGSSIRIAGFVVPLDNAKGPLREFLLVPYFGACIHVPPPPSNQIIHVVRSKAGQGGAEPKEQKELKAMDAVWVSGRLTTVRVDTAMGTSGYRMSADLVQAYTQ